MVHTIAIAYSNHRPEALSYTLEAMRHHEVVFLEEAPDAGFDAMLDGRLAIYVIFSTRGPILPKLTCWLPGRSFSIK